jgi:hypothetical protein
VQIIIHVRHIVVHPAEPLVPGPIRLEVGNIITKLEMCKSPSDQFLIEIIQAGGKTLKSVNNKLINSIWNKKEFPDQWKESIIVRIHKKSYKTDCNNYHEISLLSISYKILSNIPLLRLSLYTDEITGNL